MHPPMVGVIFTPAVSDRWDEPGTAIQSADHPPRPAIPIPGHPMNEYYDN